MQTPDLSLLAVKLFADGADLATMRNLSQDPLIRGFTTNPTLMRKAGVHDYEAFARAVLGAIPELPISFEVLSDELSLMAGEGGVIGSWGENVYVKIPITNTRGETTVDVIAQLNQSGVKVNVTAVMTLDQVREAAGALTSGTPAIISVFAGRIADTGVDPMPLMAEAVSALRPFPWVELLWASPRELLNIFHAEAVGCHIITATIDILSKRHLVGKDLNQYSLDTVRMFEEDSRGLGLTVAIG